MCSANGSGFAILAVSKGGVFCTCSGMRCCSTLQALCLILCASCKCELACPCFKRVFIGPENERTGFSSTPLGSLRWVKQWLAVSVWSVPCKSEVLKWRPLRCIVFVIPFMFQQKTLVLGISFLIRTASAKVMHLMGKSSFIFLFAQNRVVSGVVSFATCSYMYGAPLLNSLQKLDILLWNKVSGSRRENCM